MSVYRQLNFDNVEEEKEFSTLVEVKSQQNENIKSTVDIVFAFDTTGSMESVLESVRNNLSTTVNRLFEEVDGIHIGLLTFGDYCDAPNTVWKMNPTTDKNSLQDFIKNAPSTKGGDAEECYEYVLRLAHSDIEWKSEVKVFVLIGDENPHEVGYYLPKKCKDFNSILDINWEEECIKCREKNISVFTCHALAFCNQQSVNFYKKVSNITRGYYFELDELKAFNDYMVGICCKVGDVVEDFQLIKERYHRLKQEEKNETDENVKRKMKEELKESEDLFQSLEHESLFTTPKLKKHCKLPSLRKRKTRLENFSQELNNDLFELFMKQAE